MKVLLTGITGNVGYELAQELIKRKIEIVALVRKEKKELVSKYVLPINETIEHDLTSNTELVYNKTIDCIVHAAGNVHFTKTNHSNEQMIIPLIQLAKSQSIPLYFVSTAFVYRPDNKTPFNNSYEQDKFLAEEKLIHANIPYTIFRPSIITGNSKTGVIQNFSGYYTIVSALLQAIYQAKAHNRLLRFFTLPGNSDIVAVDHVTKIMVDHIEKNIRGTFFLTNPHPPSASWLVNETLNFFQLESQINIISTSWDEYQQLILTPEEEKLTRLLQHFTPYWSMNYSFPHTIYKDNDINSDYIKKILLFFKNQNKL